MKKLTLIRHAHSEQLPGQSDFQRPLSTQGTAETATMAAWLHNQGVYFDQVFYSPALRAAQTARILFSPTQKSKTQIIDEKQLYNFDHHTVYQFLESVDDRFSNIALVGHNPALSELGSFLCIGFTDYLATCTIAQFAVPIDHWIDINRGSAKLVFLQMPATCSITGKN